MASALAALARLILSSEQRRRRFLLVLLNNALVYAVSMAVLAFGSYRGLFEARPAALLSAAMGATVLLFYLLFRSGFNERFADPTLSAPQSIAAQTLVAASYGVAGPVHAGALVLFPMVTFFGMFDLKPRYGRMIAAYAVALVGAVMWWRCETQPLLYRPLIELTYFVLLATSMFAVTEIATQSSTMRARLKAQKTQLGEALAHIQQMATHDELTGLANRRHVLDLLAEHVTRLSRGGPACYVAIADLDHFKRINDTHGHAVGDDALRTFARLARTHLRATDIIARWGGEEFLVLLPEWAAGDPAAGDPAAGDPAAGETAAGDRAPRDSAASAPAAGGSAERGTAPGSPAAGDPAPGGPVVSDRTVGDRSHGGAVAVDRAPDAVAAGVRVADQPAADDHAASAGAAAETAAGGQNAGSPAAGNAMAGLDRLRDALAVEAASSQVPALRVGFSAGISRYREGEAVAETIERADRALYAAKAAGRNRTHLL